MYAGTNPWIHVYVVGTTFPENIKALSLQINTKERETVGKRTNIYIYIYNKNVLAL